MLRVKLGQAFSFLSQTDINQSEAFQIFLGGVDLTQFNISEEMLQGLSGEWLLFDYKSENGKTLVEQYFFKNPTDLNKVELDELKQIIETQSLHLLQTYSASRPPYVFLQSVYTNKKFKVYDRSLSMSIDDLDGSFFGRVAKVGKTYYLVGSDPITVPIRYTQRSIAIFEKEKTPEPSLKDIVQSFRIKKEQKKKAVNITSERKKLESRYKTLASKFKIKVTFGEIVKFIYKEQYQQNFADYLTDLMKMGIPEKTCLDNVDFFQNMWNYFPHKQLGGKCPHELFEVAYLTEK